MTDLSKAAADALSFQAYEPHPAIDGVWTHKLVKRRSDNGFFMEYARLSQGKRGGSAARLYG